MIKKLNDSDLDEIMDFWKQESLKLDNSLKNNMTDRYNFVKDGFSNKAQTTVYTEEDSICGYVVIDETGTKILGVLVKEEMRREGIGSVLIQNCKKNFSVLTAQFPKKNKVAKLFFEKNGFKIIEEENNEYIMEWRKSEESNIKLLYFDEDINENFLKESLKIPYSKIDVKSIIDECNLESLEVYSIKAYMKFRKKFEDLMNTESILLYIDYNNYHKFLDDQIKEIVKIKKINLNVLLCEPFMIENSKKDNIVEEIEESYKNYNIIKFDCALNNFEEDVTLNQIFSKRMEVLSKKIQEIAQNI